MLRQIIALTACNLRLSLRDRILHAVLGVAFVLLLLVPSLSSFSMRQVQELAITLSLSITSFCLLVITLLLGSSAVWRDVERRYTASILTLPVSRATFLLGKFCSIAVFLAISGTILGLATACIIPVAAAQYDSDLPVVWGNILLAVGADVVKYILLAAVAILLSAVSTSFFLPFFGTISIYLAGSAAQEVYEYVSGQLAEGITPESAVAIKGVYYLLPNFTAFDFKVHAVYALPVTIDAVFLPLLYAVTYTGILLGLAILAFNRRQLS